MPEITGVETYQIPTRHRKKALATFVLLVAGTNITACGLNQDKHCESVGTHRMAMGETAWTAIDPLIPAEDREKGDKQERMTWIEDVNPGVKIGDVEIGQELHVPGKCE